MSDTGGPAFPVDPGVDLSHPKTPTGYMGMTLLDYAAIHAPTDDDNDTRLDAEKTLGLKEGEYKYEIHSPMLEARRRYDWAEAMIAERKRRMKG